MIEAIDELPILGEPLPVELANTRYGEAEEFIDFLETRSMMRTWLQATQIAGAVELRARDHARLLTLRDAMHGILSATVESRKPSDDELAVIGTMAGLGRPHPVLHWSPAPRWTWMREGSAAVVMLAELAEAAGSWLAGPDLERVRRCPGQGCTMFFVQAHHRRRFCHPSCSHRARQAAYYRRKRDRP